jgi:hypothetical protein
MMLMTRYRDYFMNYAAAMFLGSAVSAFGATVTDDEVKQKLQYVDTVISSSAAAKRIAASDDAEAKAKYQAAQERLKDARSAFASGNLDVAGARSAEALSLMSQAAQRVPSESVQQMARARNDRLLKSVDTLEASWRAAAGGPGGQDASGLDSGKIRRMIDAAGTLAAAGKYDEANNILSSANDEVSDALSKLHGNKTISYEMIFTSAAEEYAYEVERYISLEDAIPLAMEQMQPSQKEIADAQEFIDMAKARRRDADAEAQHGKFDAALGRIKDGSLQMETALNVLGVTY